MKKKYFFGWTNIKFLITEVIKMYSNQDSFFSKKRIEGGIGFVVLQYGMVRWIIINGHACPASELFIWSSIEGAVCGYFLSKIQEEKKDDNCKPVN